MQRHPWILALGLMLAAGCDKSAPDTTTPEPAAPEAPETPEAPEAPDDLGDDAAAPEGDEAAPEGEEAAPE